LEKQVRFADETQIKTNQASQPKVAPKDFFANMTKLKHNDGAPAANTRARLESLNSVHQNHESSTGMSKMNNKWNEVQKSADANHVAIISHMNQECNEDSDVHLLVMKGYIGKTEINDIIFDNGAAITCLNAEAFERLDVEFKSKLLRCKDKWQLTNATGGSMTVLGELTIDLELCGPNELIKFNNINMVVVKGLRSDMLFGRNVMKKSQLIRYTVDYELNSIEFEHKNDILILNPVKNARIIKYQCI